MITTTEQMKSEFTMRANAAELDVHCLMDGSLYSTIAVVAEAPGDTECRVGRPLVGGSGTHLWNTLRPQKITRADCYVTNVVKKKLIERDDSKAVLSRHELDHWSSLLTWELLQLPNLRYVFALGNHALRALTGHEGITSWRGSVLEVTLEAEGVSRTVKVICANNPALVLREPKNEIVFALDCAKLRRVIDGKHNPNPMLVHINPTPKQAIDFIRGLRADRIPIATDIETIGGETACIGFANRTDEAMCISFRDLTSNRFDTSDEARIRQEIQSLSDDRATRYVMQNGMFDMSWLWYKDKIALRKAHFDTMLAHHTLYPQLPHNLGFLTTQYTDHPYYKDEKDDWKEAGDIDSFWRYNGHDCCITLAVFMRELDELRASKLDRFFFEHVMRLQMHLVRLTVGGIRVDTTLKDRLFVELEQEVQQKLRVFQEAARAATGEGEDYEPNPSSPKQLSDLLFNKLKLVGRGSSTNAENRTTMYNHPRTKEEARAVIRAIDEYAKEKKFFSTYASMNIDPDQRFRCEWKQTGVQSAPGRLSSAATWWGCGMNAQNQPLRAQQMYIADPGYCFIYFDLSQAEARVVGWLANIPTWIRDFERARVDGKYDCHRALAAEMFGVPYDEVPTKDRDASDNPTIRYIAKRCRHGLNYRMAPDRLSLTTGLSRSEAYRSYEIYHKINPELRHWWAALEQEIRTTKALYNAFGRRLPLLERPSTEALESIVAFKPQSTIGDKVCRVIYKAHDDPKWPRSARLGINVHDALIGLAPIDKAKDCLRILRKYAEEPILFPANPINVGGKTIRSCTDPLIIPMDAGISVPDEQGLHRWSTIKKISREDYC